MYLSSIFPYTLLFVISLLLIKSALSKDIVNQTCKACSEIAPSPEDLSYEFCSASLGSVPVSHATNLPGLGFVALELAVENSTNTVSIITKMLQDNSGFDHPQKCTDCLKTCLKLYTDITVKLKECVVDFITMNYDPVFMWVILIREATEICEDGFIEQGIQSPLTLEKYSLTQLCSIVLCVMEEFLARPRSFDNMLRAT